MKIKFLVTTGLFIHTSLAMAWVLDDTMSTFASNQIAAEESIQPDLFEQAEKSTPAENLLSNLNLSELLSISDPEPIISPVAPALVQSTPDVDPIQKMPYLLEKKVSSLTPKDIANNQYNIALQKIELKQYAEAEKMFLDILKNYPPHTLSRVQLSKMAILNNDYILAEKWLIENPDYFSNHPAYLQTLALVYERTGKKEVALKVLEQMPTEYRKTVEFYSLLASLYQQTGNHVLAQRYYNGLLNREPGNAAWLLGLSVSLDSGGEKKMALTYYKQLLEHRDLDPKILSFVNKRFEKLSKR